MKVDLLIKKVNVFNSQFKKFIQSDVAILNGKFLYIGTDDIEKLDPVKIIRGKGKYLIPGLIDIHLHVESSMVTPGSFSKELIKNGVTSVVTDPHEIANVFGIEGIMEMIKNDNGCVADIFYGVPSSVPTTPFETTGAQIGPDELSQLLKEDKVVCLGEVMNYKQVLEEPDSK